MVRRPAVDDERWLHAWSAAAALPEWRRVPALVAALGDGAVDDPEDWPLGAVAASAMALVAPLCGGTLHASAACATCGEAMEVTLPVADLVALAATGGEAAGAIDTAGHRLTLRRPRRATSPPSPLGRTTSTWPRGMLLGRCVTAADPELPTPVPAAMVAEIEAALEALDPLAVVTLESTCPACGSPDAPVLDLLDCAWTVVEAHARRLLGEVHRLARAYGWREARRPRPRPQRAAPPTWSSSRDPRDLVVLVSA